ncbi:hypothetical protein C8R45DRAFT_1003463 [Mycena sanguinolenta]|nr:hypothetical protein C8R45DRAFT_1003463 [Mycena sanguinolenta]
MESRLPPELERQIFEIAANSHSKSIPTLLLVARRVKIWLEPILYNVVFLSPSPSGFEFQSPAISQHVRHLCITYAEVSPRCLDPILANYSAVQNLALAGRHSGLLPFISAMPLRRMSTNLANLFSSGGIDFMHPLFSRITHLQVWDNLDTTRWEDWRGLAAIPNLTHLAFLMTKSFLIFQNTLAACPGLKVLIYQYSSLSDNPEFGVESLAHDTRFVCLHAKSFYVEWQRGARGGEDFWVRAEKFIARRNCGEIASETFLLREG